MERLDYYENGVDFLVDFSNEEVLEIKRKVSVFSYVWFGYSSRCFSNVCVLQSWGLRS